MTLVDTSVWVDHLRNGTPRLKALLTEDQVVCHPFIIGELASGHLRRRAEILTLLAALPQARLAEHHEVLELLESARLYGRGLGWVDLHLLASAMISGVRFWTLAKALGKAAASLSVAG